MFQGQQLFDDVMREVQNWVPNQEYDRETKFRDELKKYLDEELNSGGDGLMGRQEPVPLRSERGKSRADIVVDDTVGIELKRDFDNGQRDRLETQIRKQMDEYPFLIVLTCGIDDTGGWRELEKEFQGNQGIEGNQVEFIWKKKENYGKDQSQSQQGGQDPLGGGGLF